MIAFWIVAVLVIGGLLAWAAGRSKPAAARWISAGALAIDLALVIWAWLRPAATLSRSGARTWLADVDWSWIPRFGIRFHLVLDGLSLVLVALTVFIGFLAVLASWKGITKRVGFFHFNLLWVLAGIAGVFLAADLFLFYFFWELMLVPMYFLIGIWGHENRIYASFKFFLFTQASGLAMLVSILALHVVHVRATGIATFDYTQLLGTTLTPAAGLWITLGFVLAFAVKIAVVPFHTWLPDAHTEAPTAGSIILAGLLLKTGAYGLLRFAVPLSRSVPAPFASVMMALGAVSILYGAKLAFAQTDLKRLVAYTSVSHMGFVLLGVFSFNALAFQGAVMQIVCHGISTGALFFLAGALQDRLHTRDMAEMGGLWQNMPRLGAAGMLFAMASLGLPGLGNFVAEFLVLAGSYQTSRVFTVIAALGFIVSTIYALSLVQRVFHGETRRAWSVGDLEPRELLVCGLLAVAIVWLGIYPQPVLDTIRAPLEGIMGYPAQRPTITEAHAVPGSIEMNVRAVQWREIPAGSAAAEPPASVSSGKTAGRPGVSLPHVDGAQQPAKTSPGKGGPP